MIWQSKHITQHGLKSKKIISDKTIEIKDLRPSPATECIAIVGGGPKGFYALERLLAQLKDAESTTNLEIHIFNTNSFFACGQNYRPDQPDYLLINYAIGNIDAWEVQQAPQIVTQRLNLTEWIKHNKHEQCPEVNPRDFASRELVGYYLMDCLQHVVQVVPKNVSIRLISTQVEDIIESTSTYTLYADNQRLPFAYESILLVTGNSYHNSYLENAQQHAHVTCFNSAYPIRQLDLIPDQADVAIQGYGLTFTDVALHLTEGRGGRFEYQHNELIYIPSGREPILYPYSRNNLMMLPRSGMLPEEKYELIFFTDHYIDSVRQRNRENKISFKKDIAPILQKEIQYAYNRLAREDDGLTEMEVIDKLFFPNKDLDSPQLENYHQYMLEITQYMQEEAAKGISASPFMLAVHACRACLLQMAKVYNFCGMDGKSHEYFDRKWSSNMNRLSFGPPAENSKKIHALLKAGYIQAKYGKLPAFRFNSNGLELFNDYYTKTFQYHIDGRIAKPNLAAANNHLYGNLFKSGMVRELINDSYHTGSIAIHSDGTLIGKENSMLYVYGTPTEGNVLDNDTLSRKSYNFGNIWAHKTASLVTTKYKKQYEHSL
ncbi:FAD/NAD(P)-binding protein [Sphingobacterium olei]|nr:FAD/NAD(P)-binding protein [Sphingobacterium olei]